MVGVAKSFADILTILFSFFIVLSVHEAAHAGVAYLLGDGTAKRMGRLSLNPLAHIDPLGALCLVVFRIGWAKPVIFDPRNFKRPRLYSVLTAYAGPASNFLLTVMMLLFVRFFPLAYLPVGVSVTMTQICITIAQISVMLGVFNLLPLPPLDGSHILMVLFARRFPRFLMWLYRYSFFILVGLFLFVPQFLHFLRVAIEVVYMFFLRLIFGL